MHDPTLQPLLHLSLQQPDGRHRSVLTRAKVRRWVRATLVGGGEVTIRVVDETEARRLNREFRQRDYATNVLTFDYERRPVVVADVVLCASVVESEARAQGLTLDAHYAHLVVHGVLHAQGFDHERSRDAKRMEARETELLRALGYDDPYAL